MKTRALFYGLCLIAAGATTGHAQALAPGPNSAPSDTPKIDSTKKTPNSTGDAIPEVIKPATQHGDVIQPKSTQDPAAVLQPPNVDPKMPIGRPAASGGEAKADPK
jgi:hypothetical protein